MRNAASPAIFEKVRKHNNVASFTHKAKCIRRIVDILEISLIENSDDILRQLRRRSDRSLACEMSVPVGLFGLAIKIKRVRGVIAASIAVKMMAIIRAGRFDRFRAKNCGDQFVGDKSVLAK